MMKFDSFEDFYYNYFCKELNHNNKKEKNAMNNNKELNEKIEKEVTEINDFVYDLMNDIITSLEKKNVYIDNIDYISKPLNDLRELKKKYFDNTDTKEKEEEKKPKYKLMPYEEYKKQYGGKKFTIKKDNENSNKECDNQKNDNNFNTKNEVMMSKKTVKNAFTPYENFFKENKDTFKDKNIYNDNITLKAKEIIKPKKNYKLVMMTLYKYNERNYKIGNIELVREADEAYINFGNIINKNYDVERLPVKTVYLFDYFYSYENFVNESITTANFGKDFSNFGNHTRKILSGGEVFKYNELYIVDKNALKTIAYAIISEDFETIDGFYNNKLDYHDLIGSLITLNRYELL